MSSTEVPAARPRLLLSAREAAETLSISERTLWTLTQRGEIPCVRIGTRVLYSPAALAEWIASQQSHSA